MLFLGFKSPAVPLILFLFSVFFMLLALIFGFEIFYATFSYASDPILTFFEPIFALIALVLVVLLTFLVRLLL